MIAYYSHPSPIHALDPRVKIMWSVVVSLLAVVWDGPLFLGGLFAITILPWCFAHPPFARLRLLFLLAGNDRLRHDDFPGLFLCH